MLENDIVIIPGASIKEKKGFIIHLNNHNEIVFKKKPQINKKRNLNDIITVTDKEISEHEALCKGIARRFSSKKILMEYEDILQESRLKVFLLLRIDESVTATSIRNHIIDYKRKVQLGNSEYEKKEKAKEETAKLKEAEDA